MDSRKYQTRGGSPRPRPDAPRGVYDAPRGVYDAQGAVDNAPTYLTQLLWVLRPIWVFAQFLHIAIRTSWHRMQENERPNKLGRVFITPLHLHSSIPETPP